MRVGLSVLLHLQGQGCCSRCASAGYWPYIVGIEEEDAINRADLIVLVGFDPVEGPPQPWRYLQPLLELTEYAFDFLLFDAESTVVDDRAQSLILIGAKQRRRQMAAAVINFMDADFATVATGLRWEAVRVTQSADLIKTIDIASGADKPVLFDVVIDPSEYHEHIAALRG